MSTSQNLATIDAAIAQIAAGRPIIVVDDEDRENEGDLIMAAEAATSEWMGFMVRHTSGVICAPMPQQRAGKLQLPPMVADNEDPKGTAYTVSCDAKVGTTTGISAADRALTARVLANPMSVAGDLNRPGHVFPLVARAGGVRERAGHTEAGVELARLAGSEPVAVIAEIVHDDGSMMRLDALLDFGAEHGLLTVTIADLIAWLDKAEGAAEPNDLELGEPVALPAAHGAFTARAATAHGTEHLVLEAGCRAAVDGADAQRDSAPLVRVHSECLTGDVLGSRRCDCGEQLDAALDRIAAEGGAVVYVRGHEGRGIGLGNKLRAYRLQEQGLDTLDANTALGFPVDARDYADAAAILRSLGYGRVRLLTNNPDKVAALREHGIDVVERVGISVPARAENAVYLDAKRTRMRHALPASHAPALPEAQTAHAHMAQSHASHAHTTERKVS